VILRLLLLSAALFAATPALARPTDAIAMARPPSCRGTSLAEDLRANAPARLEAALERAARVPNGDGLLWRIERSGVAPSHLFGTMNVTDPRITTLAPAVRQALAAARVVAVELAEVAEPQDVRKFGFHLLQAAVRPGDTLAFLGTGPMRGEVEAMVSEIGMPASAARQFRPWFLATLLQLPACESARHAAGLAALDRLIAESRSVRAELVGLETPAEQVAAIASVEDAVAQANVIAAARHKERRNDVFATMVDFYQQRRFAAVREVIVEAGLLTAEEVQASAALEAALRKDRDPRLAERSLPLLAGGGAFIAVGALHLPGESGLIERFRRAGYSVVRVW
jgi:uncharacterized protein